MLHLKEFCGSVFSALRGQMQALEADDIPMYGDQMVKAAQRWADQNCRDVKIVVVLTLAPALQVSACERAAAWARDHSRATFRVAKWPMRPGGDIPKQPQIVCGCQDPGDPESREAARALLL